MKKLIYKKAALMPLKKAEGVACAAGTNATAGCNPVGTTAIPGGCSTGTTPA